MIKKDLTDHQKNSNNITINYSTSINSNISSLYTEKENTVLQEHLNKLSAFFEEDQDEAGYNLALKLTEDFPTSAESFSFLGRFLLKMKKPQEALIPMEKALSLAPNNHEINAHISLVYFNINKIEEAEQSCLRSIQLNASYAKAYANLAIIKKVKGELNTSAQYFEKAIELAPKAAATRINFGNLLREVGYISEAEKQYKQALTHASKDMQYVIYNNLGTISAHYAKNHEAQQYYQKALNINPQSAEVFSNMLLDMSLDISLTSEEIFNNHKEYGRRFEKEEVKNKFTFNIDKNTKRKLKIGFVSADLRIHPVSYFLETLLNNLNKDILDITLYSTNNREDELTKRFQEIPLTWVNISGLYPVQMAEKINHDSIDILIDLSGHTANNSLALFTYKPAPIQVTWIGYFNTTGLQSMDYIFCDKFVIPQDNDKFYTETPFRFDDGYLCFTPPEDEISILPPPVLKNGYITFGCFNQLKKMGDEVVELWAKVLQQTPHSKLFLKSASLSDINNAQHETIAKFQQHGIAPERLILEGRTSREAYFNSYNEIDIALDPFPYTGGTTTVEGLWMGVPVVTLQGQHYVSKMGVSILNAVDLADWVAIDQAAYVNLAIEKATDITSLTALRSNLRQQMLSSSLCDAPRFSRKLEQALQQMWQTYCQ